MALPGQAFLSVRQQLTEWTRTGKFATVERARMTNKGNMGLKGRAEGFSPGLVMYDTSDVLKAEMGVIAIETKTTLSPWKL